MNQRIHAKYFSRFLNLLPPKLGNHDSTRATIAFFAVSGIDVLDCMNALSEEAKQHIIEWILSLQVTPKEGGLECGGFQVCSGCVLWLSRFLRNSFGFIPYQGATTLNVVDPPPNCALDNYKWGHLAMTYTSIAILVILGDDLSRLDRKTIIKGELGVKTGGVEIRTRTFDDFVAVGFWVATFRQHDEQKLYSKEIEFLSWVWLFNPFFPLNFFLQVSQQFSVQMGHSVLHLRAMNLTWDSSTARAASASCWTIGKELIKPRWASTSLIRS
jgi:hypothetical protein